ncbi:SDR family NAD(P)-dependent oxidoreductase [Bacillus sp. es.036]|uniref:SDR family NAD(P)-dependent oxidoreductase n=1 Tax=Bacillus sp. es.036 TaxID=1761764 RepID=UPI000BF693A5|nr:SDR family oxidoreductase [Bacillus sp. es.036]PFG02988.1 short-subunit dehydrogenase [Bacillus sp. es.036]
MKTILITGAGSGLGAELAKRWAKEGHRMVLVGRTKEKLTSICHHIEKENATCLSYQCDITNPDDLAHLTKKLKEDDLSIDLLVNNAGIGTFGSLEEMTISDIHHVIDTNVKGTIFTTQAFLPILKERKGRIMNIISTAGLKGKKHESVYVASKYAVRGFTESLWKELEGTGVSATAVYMGGMNTPFWSHSNHISDPTRLKSALEKAKQIIEEDKGQKEIFIDR